MIPAPNLREGIGLNASSPLLLFALYVLNEPIRFGQREESKLVTRKKKKSKRNLYTASDIKLLKQYSKARTPVSKIAKLMKRTEGSLRQKALRLGIGLGHQR
jgi:hypothetical protein